MGEAEASPIWLVKRTGLVALNFAYDTRSIQTRPCVGVKLNRQVTFGEFLGAQVADEGEPMAPLELGDGDDVALESNFRLDILAAIAAGQSEYQLCTRVDGRCGLRCDRSRSRSARQTAEEVQRNRTVLRRSAVYVERSVGDRDTCVKPGRIGHEREEQVASANTNLERITRGGLVAPTRNRIRRGRGLNRAQRSERSRHGRLARSREVVRRVSNERHAYRNAGFLDSERIGVHRFVDCGEGVACARQLNCVGEGASRSSCTLSEEGVRGEEGGETATSEGGRTCRRHGADVAIEVGAAANQLQPAAGPSSCGDNSA